MTARTRRLLSSLLVVLWVLPAGAASAALFHSEGESTSISASQVLVSTISSTAGQYTCEAINMSGTGNTKTLTSIEFSVTASGCHMITFGSTTSAQINFNGCTYRIYSSGTMDIVCPAGKEIEGTALGCTVKFPAQTGLKSVSVTNRESHVDFNFNVSGIKYSHSGFDCGTGSGSNATLKGTYTASGSKGKVWYE